MTTEIDYKEYISEETIRDLKDWVANYINDNCIYRVAPDEEPIDGKESGTKDKWQFYMKRGLFNRSFLNSIGILFWNEFKDLYYKKPFQVASSETTSDPIIVAIAMTSHIFDIDVNTFSIRSERKKYGIRNRFEGIIDYDLPVLIVDDIFNSENHFVKLESYCEEEGLETYSHNFAIINNTEEKTLANVKTIFDSDMFMVNWKDYDNFARLLGRKKREFVLEKNRD